MAKATKTKKAIEVVEEPKVELPQEPIIEIPEIGETPPSVTLDEVKEVDETIKHEVNRSVEGLVPIASGIFTNKADEGKPATWINVKDMSMEEKIINFIESRTGEIKMNDFLKSLFGVPKFNEPPAWLSQRASKELRATLSKLSNEGAINIVSNNHMKLGAFYYPDMTTGKTEYHNLNTVQIVAIK